MSISVLGSVWLCVCECVCVCVCVWSDVSSSSSSSRLPVPPPPPPSAPIFWPILGNDIPQGCHVCWGRFRRFLAILHTNYANTIWRLVTWPLAPPPSLRPPHPSPGQGLWRHRGLLFNHFCSSQITDRFLRPWLLPLTPPLTPPPPSTFLIESTWSQFKREWWQIEKERDFVDQLKAETRRL